MIHSPADKLQLQPSINLQVLSYGGFEADVIGKMNSKWELRPRFFINVTSCNYLELKFLKRKADLIHMWIYMQQN